MDSPVVVVSLADVTLLFEGGQSVVVSGIALTSPPGVMLLFEAGWSAAGSDVPLGVLGID